MTAPLTGVRVADFTHMLAGPYCTTLLGDLGADVIKVEQPGRGDALRYTDRIYPGPDGAYYLGVNRNKRSLGLDLRRPAGLEVAQRLIGSCDVLVENLRPGAMARLGLGFDAVHARNPRLVYCSISAFGQTGPMAERAGMDLVVQALSGVMGHTGEAGRPPVRVAASIADFTGALYGSVGVLAALVAARQSGTGQWVTTNLLDGQVSLLSNLIPGFMATGEPSGPVGATHPQLVPYQVFQTLDGYLVVACLTNSFWQALCRALVRPDLAADERLRTNPGRLEHREELVGVLTKIFAERPTAYWVDCLDAEDVPNAPINRLSDVVGHPQVQHNRTITQLAHPVAGEVPIAATPLAFSATGLRPPVGASAIGQDTDQVLAELGYGRAEVERLAAEGVIPARDNQNGVLQ